LFFRQERPQEDKKIEPKKTKKDAKMVMTRAISVRLSSPKSACPFFRFLSFLSAIVVLVAAEGRAAQAGVQESYGAGGFLLSRE
jgi:hypothetical protein